MQDFSLYSERRTELCQEIRKKYKKDNGIILLCANVESDRIPFRQDSSFYYLTGLTEPGLFLTIDLESQKTRLFIPKYTIDRKQWMATGIFDFVCDEPSVAEIDELVELGDPIAGYTLHLYENMNHFAHLTAFLKTTVLQNKPVFTLLSEAAQQYVQQRTYITRFAAVVPSLAQSLVDISGIVAQMRRLKHMKEIESLFAAVEITAMAHEAAAAVIKPGIGEAEVHGNIAYVMYGSNATEAFASIVGSGFNSTVLHYHKNNDQLKTGELVVVDIGAEKDMYCADLTRTYPVSGRFSARQKVVYELVLETQEYIASIAKPGMYLKNNSHHDQSLHHLAKAFLAKAGYEQYFPHGIGHYLGLDVHDVGSYQEPLQEGDVFTIEPGIYIPEEALGVRIEDDYWLTPKGAVCLSEGLPKTVAEVQQAMADKSE
ncbi:aminopeptidase P N-terminal domain-containing protein [bacterium]|nr:MAG: aminopeptidase P N-terminal domain-containing protein [bacterium]QQR61996.1 MAG: aminopeptidase P N-terminal domain-containing protein [bacterium]